MNMSDPLNHLGSIWYHSEPSDVPYSLGGRKEKRNLRIYELGKSIILHTIRTLQRLLDTFW